MFNKPASPASISPEASDQCHTTLEEWQRCQGHDKPWREMELWPSPQRSHSAAGNQISCPQPFLGEDTAGSGACDAASLLPNPCPIHIPFSPLSKRSRHQPLKATALPCWALLPHLLWLFPLASPSPEQSDGLTPSL